MSAAQAFHRCPRCDVRALLGEGGGEGKALSRTTRDEGADIFVCSDCGEREAVREAARYPPVPFTDWPLDVDDLLREDRARYEYARRGEMSLATIDPDEARRLLGGGE
jgi:NAD(P)-dependent dehydrogenase (short-subunit alcohol dehydrogenase family)